MKLFPDFNRFNKHSAIMPATKVSTCDLIAFCQKVFHNAISNERYVLHLQNHCADHLPGAHCLLLFLRVKKARASAITFSLRCENLLALEGQSHQPKSCKTCGLILSSARGGDFSAEHHEKEDSSFQQECKIRKILTNARG